MPNTQACCGNWEAGRRAYALERTPEISLPYMSRVYDNEIVYGLFRSTDAIPSRLEKQSPNTSQCDEIPVPDQSDTADEERQTSFLSTGSHRPCTCRRWSWAHRRSESGPGRRLLRGHHSSAPDIVRPVFVHCPRPLVHQICRLFPSLRNSCGSRWAPQWGPRRGKSCTPTCSPRSPCARG